MSKSELQPPRELLDKVMAVADVKAELPSRHRAELSDWGVYCRVNRLPGGRLFYQAGRRMVGRLRFTVENDGSTTVQKYHAGEWERKLEPTYARAMYYLACSRTKDEIDQIIIKCRNTDEKICALEERTEKNPTEVYAWEELYYLYPDAKRFRDMEKAAARCVELVPGRAEYHCALGQLYSMALLNTESVAPSSYLTVRALGSDYERIYYLAESHLQRTLKLASPRDKELRSLAKKWLSQLELVHKGASLEEKPEAQLLKILDGFQEQPKELAKRLEQMVHQEPDFALAWSHLSWAYVRLGRLKDAERVAMKAVELAPDNGPCHFNLSTIYYLALCSSRGYDWDSIERFKDMIGQEQVQRLRHVDPHIFPEEEPPPWMQRITLEALGCSYEYARQMVEKHARETIRLSADREFTEEAKSQLATLGMIAEKMEYDADS